MASKYISEFIEPWPPCVSANSHGHGIQVHTMMPSQHIPNLAQSLLRSASPCTLDYGLQVHLQSHSIMVFKYRLSWSPNSLSILNQLQPSKSDDYGVNEDLQTRLIVVSKFVQFQHRSTSAQLLKYTLQVKMIMASKVYLHTRLIMDSKCKSIFMWPPSSGAPQIVPKYHLQLL